VEEAAEETYAGITVVPGPAVVLEPSFVICPGEYKARFPSPELVKISARSTLIVRGPDVVIESLDLDGALVIDGSNGKHLTISDMVVKNAGWVRIADETSNDEVIKMRGYRIDKKETEYIGSEADCQMNCEVL
jgi:UDP-sugar pyrophosphorylase